MKKVFNVAVVFIVLSALSFIPPKHDLVGRWITYNTDGSIGYVDFTKEGTFKVTSTAGEVYHQGNYKLENDVFSINDKEGCGDTYWGTYKFSFVNDDSVQISVMTDTCTGRRMQITTGNTGIKRVKN
jgi:hypothetical protein